MPKIVFRLFICLTAIYFYIPLRVVRADYTFFDNFNLGLNQNWQTISNHVQPTVVSGSLEFDIQSPLTSIRFPYISQSYIEPINIINFDFKYVSDGSDFGSGVVLTENVPTSEISPPVDSGDYILAIYTMGDGKFYMFSPLCNVSCGIPLHKYIFFEFQPDTNYHLRFNFSVNYFDIYVDNFLIKSFPMSLYRANGVYFGNSMKTSTPKNWPHFWIDNVNIFYHDYDVSLSTFPYLSQKDSAWAGEEYDTAHEWSPGKEGIDRWGCALTSVAMILQNYGVKALDGTPIDPSKLNSWLKSQTDGYIGPGLVNWLVITRYVKGRVPGEKTSLEFVRSYDKASAELPAVLGLPGHFVVAHGEDATSWNINDPASTSSAMLAKASTVRSINRYILSNTDLSYMLFTAGYGVTATLTDDGGTPITTAWTEEYLTDDVGGLPSPSLFSALVPKPAAGRYHLTINNGNAAPGQFTIYLYDQEGRVKKDEILSESGLASYDIDFNVVNSGDSQIDLVDTTPPSLTSKNIFSGWYRTPQIAKFYYTNDLEQSCVINSEGIGQTCTISPNVCDLAVNCNINPQTSNPADIDLTPPTSTFALPIITNSWDGMIEGSANDNLSGIAKVELIIKKPDGTTVTKEVNGTSVWTYTFPSPVDGKYVISSKATDVAGNIQNDLTRREIVLDTKAPAPPKIHFILGWWQKIVMDWRGVTGANRYRIYYGTKKNELNRTSETVDTEWISENLKQGQYYVALSAIDQAGNESPMSKIWKVEVHKKWDLRRWFFND